LHVGVVPEGVVIGPPDLQLAALAMTTSPSPTSSATPSSDPRTAKETDRSWLDATRAMSSAAAPPTTSSAEIITTTPQREMRGPEAGPSMEALYVRFRPRAGLRSARRRP
jgi:hypothetical protein